MSVTNNTKWTQMSLLLGMVIAVESIALYSLQKYQKSQNKNFMMISMLVYGIAVPVLLYKMLKYEGIGMVNFCWNVGSTLMGFTIGILLFKEKVNNLQWMGVMLGILAFGLIYLGNKKSSLPAKSF